MKYNSNSMAPLITAGYHLGIFRSHLEFARKIVWNFPGGSTNFSGGVWKIPGTPNFCFVSHSLKWG